MTMSRMFWGLAVFAGLLLACSALPPEWLSYLLAGTNSSGGGVTLGAEEQRRAELTRRFDDFNERLGIKETVIEQVIRGDMTLFQAAAWFRVLNQNDPPYMQRASRRAFPGASEGEHLCRRVIHWVCDVVSAEQSTSQAEAIRERLEAQLQEHLQRHHGIVELPE